MNILVTGGAGFMGSHIVDTFVNKGVNVVALDDLSGGFKENVHERAIFIEGSITDVKLIQSLFIKYKFDYVYHLAAYAAEGLSHFIRRFNYTNNLLGSVNLINESIKHNVKCFVFTSSMAVYGVNQVPMKEDMIPAPEDPYGVAKYAVEMDLKIAHELFGLDYLIFRPHNVYGEKQNIGDKYRNVIGIFINQIMNGKKPTIFGDGLQTRAFSHISDILPIMTQAPMRKELLNDIYNIGADKPYTLNELAEVVCKAMDVPIDVVHLEERFEVKHAYSDHGKIKKYFPDIKPTSLQNGVVSMVKWAKIVGAKQSQKFKDIEIEKKLPSFWLE